MDDACKLAVSKGEAEGSPTNKTVATSLFGDREIERSQLGSPRQTFWPVAPYLLAAALFTFSSRSGLTDFGPTRRTLELARHERSFSWNWEPVSACVHGIVAPLARSSRYNKNLEFNLCLVVCQVIDLPFSLFFCGRSREFASSIEFLSNEVVVWDCLEFRLHDIKFNIKSNILSRIERIIFFFFFLDV